MPKPEDYSALRWRTIERNVRRSCNRKAKKNGWQKERTDRCVYGTLNNIRQHIQARNKRDRNVQTHTGVKT